MQALNPTQQNIGDIPKYKFNMKKFDLRKQIQQVWAFSSSYHTVSNDFLLFISCFKA